MSLAYFVNRWADLFSWRCTWVNAIWWKSAQVACIPKITASSNGGGETSSFRAHYTMRESPFIKTSLIPTSFANCIPISNAFAFASTGPNGTFIFLLKAALTFPSLSLMITPMPTTFSSAKTAPSTFALYVWPWGGSHLTSWILGDLTSDLAFVAA